ncbi:MAG: 30S ribosomal protein S12 methylthiotransferase RimO [Phycisphaerales bacterium]|nr:30S ribosomal protein S12 methylthiotransferase RimO [Planctomycetota bacterium]MCH8509864.1 30S ribosomal protein S12 methylthiotransferase RimO [Phycisphaerales bacterium]
MAHTTPDTPPQTAPDAPQDQAIRTVSFVSLGCPKNLVDSERMLGILAADGIAPVSAEAAEDAEHDDLSIAGSEQDASAAAGRITAADAVVINTCGFLEASKQESLGVIHDALEAKKRGEVKRVVVAGCLVQRHRAKMLEWAPGIDAMLGVFDREKVLEAVRGERSERTNLAQAVEEGPKYWISSNALVKAKSEGRDTVGLTVHGKDGKGIGYFESDNARLRLTPRHYAYLRISEGCNQNCAFCTIPSIRGKMRSKPVDPLVAEARELLQDGAFELLLIGQDTTSYGDDIGQGLGSEPRASARAVAAPADLFRAGLPKALKSVSDAMRQEIGKGWLRLMYAYPSNFTDEIIDAFAHLVEHGNLLPYIDIPLQHASDNMLTAMRRHVKAAQQRDLMFKLRERIPGMAIRTTFITGFPGETQADHEQLLEFIDEVGFDAVGCFKYSHEDGTVAGTMEENPDLAVPAEVKQQRHDEIMALQQEIAHDQAAFIAGAFDEDDPTNTGHQFDVLIDRPTNSVVEATSGVSAGGTLYQGRTYFQAPQIDAVTYVQSREKLAPGELVRCTVVASTGYDLIARPVTELEKKFSLPMA